MALDPSSRRAYEAEWLAGLHVSSVHLPAADPTSSGHLSRKHLGVDARLLFGRVVDGVAYLGCYKVAFSQGHPPKTCVLGSTTSALPVGARQLTTLVLGSYVWAIVHAQLPYGVIVAVEPPAMTDPTKALSDAVHQASRCGLKVDAHHNAVFRLGDRAGVTDWSARTPVDSTLAGEWGAIAETGLRVSLDSFLAQLAVDEATGVFAFYHDQLLRLAGHNMQQLSGGHELEIMDDQGEIYAYHGSTPYPWEQLGAATPGVDPFRTVSPADSQVDTPHYAAVEPSEDAQQPIHRCVAIGGYPGQGGKRLVLVPPASGIATYPATDPGAAVFEEQLALTGRYSLRSSKGISLAKRIAIPAPKRIRRVEDAAGDNPANYRPGGLGTGGPEHLVRGQVAASDPDHPHLQQAAAAADARAHALNWEGEHALHYHAKDWHLPEEADTPLGTNQAPVDFGALAGRNQLDRPPAVPLAVDHRYGDVAYYPNESYVELLDDGGVAIGDGYGSELRMTGGNVYITCPGDLFLLPGRNLNAWAGRDAIVRAKHSADISCTEADLRLKARRNLQAVAGTGGEGGLLLESKAPSAYGYADKVGEDVASGGVQIKSAGGLVAWAADIYFRTTGPAGTGGGAITLDAAAGSAAVVVNAARMDRYLAESAHDYWNASGTVQAVNSFGPGATSLAGSLACGPATVAGGLLVDGGVEVIDGHVATDQAADFDGRVTALNASSVDSARTAVRGASEAGTDAATDASSAYRDFFTDGWYADGAGGATATISAGGFSFRTTEQYKAADFVLYEARWQQMARLAGSVPATWKEDPVQAGSEATYPYPGRVRWLDAAGLYRQDLALFDPEAGVSRARDPDLYGRPTFRPAEPTTCDDNYVVII